MNASQSQNKMSYRANQAVRNLSEQLSDKLFVWIMFFSHSWYPGAFSHLLEECIFLDIYILFIGRCFVLLFPYLVNFRNWSCLSDLSFLTKRFRASSDW